MDKMAPSYATNIKKKDNKAIATGWKIQNLNKSVDSILASATRLEKEIEVETKYWEQVLAINENGWAICRLPQEKHTLGVRFGFSESAPTFKSRSLAAIRRDAEGNITLDQGLAEAKPQSLRVRIRTNNENTGSSSLPFILSDNSPIESLIRQSRNSIFSEELWQEVNREARTLAAYNVRSKEGTIICPLTPTKQLVLDLVPLGENYASSPLADDQMAEGIFLALSLVLSFVHRQHQRLRTAIPLPKSTLKNPNPPYTILRPLITRLAHENTLTAIRDLLRPLCAILTSAGISASYTAIPISQPQKNVSRLSPTETAIHSLIKGLEVKTVFQITPNVTINIISRTDIGPIAGSVHQIVVSEDCPLFQICIPPRPSDTWKTIEEYLLFATSCAVASSLSASSNIEAPFGDDDLVAQDGEDWQATYQPYTLRKRCKNGRTKQLSFLIQRDDTDSNAQGFLRATATWEWLGEGTKVKGEGSYHWLCRNSGGDEAPGTNKGWEDDEGEVVRSLREVAADAGKD